MTTSNPLIKTPTLKSDTPEEVIIVGNGAITNGNRPVERAIFENTTSFDAKIFKRNPDYMTILAMYSHAFRSLRNEYLLKCLEDVKSIPGAVESLSVIHNFKVSLGKHFEQDDELMLRESRDFIASLVSKETGIITINWDKKLWDIEGANVIQLHGVCSLPQTVILPSELSHDEDLFEFLKRIPGSEEVQNKFYSFFRADYYQHLKDCHQNAIAWLRNAKRITIWGIAFNPYDAELLSVMREGCLDNGVSTPPAFESITIVNPNKTHRDIIGAIVKLDGAKRTDIDPVAKEKVILEYF